MKVVIVLNDEFSAWHFRRGLIEALIARGVVVTIVTPDGPNVPKLVALGAKHVAVPMHRFISPLEDLRLFLHLYRVFRLERPDIVHTMTVKPNTLGAVAARLAGVPKVVGLVSGLGSVFVPVKGYRSRLYRLIVCSMYWIAGKIHNRIWFQNQDDLSLFVKWRLLDCQKAVLIRSSGINLQAYSPRAVERNAVASLRGELGIAESTRVVMMMVARLTWSKGVREFVEAAELLGVDCGNVVSVLVGPLDANEPDAVPEKYLKARESAHLIRLGWRSDLQQLLAMADVVTLPSFYREGVPRSLLEAMAMGKPIVTTDNVGCRDVVDEGKNGFLVPVRNSNALAAAIGKLVTDEALRNSFGRWSRSKVEAEFDEIAVIGKVFSELYGF
jgi:N,N'-diacetylbacillosaminyl-diphospho-undecaprenol alpha-1,3-N-acetylgalactosaminyltransferase